MNASAQSQLKNDNQEFDRLTKSFKTYSIKLFVNDSASHSSIAEIGHELKKHFTFLKSKKQRFRDADFELRIYIKGKTVGSLDYSTSSNTSQSGTIYYKHKYLVNHISSAALSLHSNERALMQINIDSNSLLQRKYSFTEVKSEYSWMGDQSQASDQKAKDEQSASNARMKAEEIWKFEKDFFELFKNYLLRKPSI